MSLYAAYLYEKEGKDSIEIDDKGFIVYQVNQGGIHIDILYVAPKYRREGLGTELANRVLDKHSTKDIKCMTAAVNTKQHNPTESLKAILSYGFKIVGTQEHEILLYKDLRNGR